MAAAFLAAQHPQRGLPFYYVYGSNGLTIQKKSNLQQWYDKLIHKFLLMDSCYKLTDKYLLAMMFVYFKRAGFIIAEYTVENFFIALHLANTMEEDEVENTYEIFPWALGKNWGILFKQFIKQRDKLWVRIKFRARVHRNVCEEVMAIEPSHPLWQRNRPEHHGFAQRQYGDQPYSLRGPWASPVFCAPCHSLTMIRRDEDSRRKTVKTECEAQISDSCAEEVPKEESSCGSTHDTSMDWIYG